MLSAAFLERSLDILTLPARLVIGALGLPESISYLSFYVANLFLIVMLGLAWRVFYSWRTRRNPEYLLFYCLLVFLASIGHLATTRIPFVWLYASAVTLIAAGLLLYANIKRPLPSSHQRLLRQFLGFGVILSLIVPVLFSVQHQFGKIRKADQLADRLEQSKVRLERKPAEAATHVAAIASNPEVVASIESKNYDRLTVQLQKEMVERGLSFITVTNAIGTTLVRANRPYSIGDNLFERTTWSAPLFSSKDISAGGLISGLALDEEYRPVAVAGVPLLDIYQHQIGALVAGYSLNQDYASKESLASGIGIAYGTSMGTSAHSSTTTSEGQIYGSADFNRYLSKAARTNKPFSTAINLGNDLYLAKGIPLATLGSGTPLLITGITKESGGKSLVVLDTLFVLGVAVIAFLSLTIGKRIRIKP